MTQCYLALFRHLNIIFKAFIGILYEDIKMNLVHTLQFSSYFLDLFYTTILSVVDWFQFL